MVALKGYLTACLVALSFSNAMLSLGLYEGLLGRLSSNGQKYHTGSNHGVNGVDEKPVPGDSPVAVCDVSEKQILLLDKVVIHPNPPVGGANLTLYAEGYLSRDVEDGAYVDVDVAYGFIKLVHQRFDLCEQLAKIDENCPIEKGWRNIKQEFELPPEVPPGRYIVSARAYTKDDKYITCLTATVDIYDDSAH